MEYSCPSCSDWKWKSLQQRPSHFRWPASLPHSSVSCTLAFPSRFWEPFLSMRGRGCWSHCRGQDHVPLPPTSLLNCQATYERKDESCAIYCPKFNIGCAATTKIKSNLLFIQIMSLFLFNFKLHLSEIHIKLVWVKIIRPNVQNSALLPLNSKAHYTHIIVYPLG